MLFKNMMINTPTSHSNLEEIIDESIKSFAIDIIKSDNLNFNSKQIDILLETSYLLTKLSSINAELQSVENEIISIQKSDHTKENRSFNKMLKEEINTLNWLLQQI
jgi:hypothetical protein